jgi:hypothetical protein
MFLANSPGTKVTGDEIPPSNCYLKAYRLISECSKHQLYTIGTSCSLAMITLDAFMSILGNTAMPLWNIELELSFIM